MEVLPKRFTSDIGFKLVILVVETNLESPTHTTCGYAMEI